MCDGLASLYLQQTSSITPLQYHPRFLGLACYSISYQAVEVSPEAWHAIPYLISHQPHCQQVFLAELQCHYLPHVLADGAKVIRFRAACQASADTFTLCKKYGLRLWRCFVTDTLM